jgi:hypothetical protein
MESRARCVVLDSNCRAELTDQTVEGGALGGAHVCRCDDPETCPAVPESPELLLEEPEAVPLDERAQQVDFVGRINLCPDLGAEVGLAVGIREESRVGERSSGADVRGRNFARPRRLGQSKQLLSRRRDLVRGLHEVIEQ